MDGTTGSAIAATAVCRACEELLGRVEGEWPGGDADRALERLRERVDGLLARPSAAASRACAEGPALEVRCLGPTRLTAGGAVIAPPRRSRLVFQYLIAHRRRPVPRDVLLEAFWPGSSPRAARNSLNVAITLLRRAFRPVYGDCPIVVFRDEAYALDPGLEVWVDHEEFERLAREGDLLRRAGDLAEAAAALPPGRRALRRARSSTTSPTRSGSSPRGARSRATTWTCSGTSATASPSLGDHEASAEAYRRILAAEPHRDDVRRLLAERYAGARAPAAWRRASHTCGRRVSRT